MSKMCILITNNSSAGNNKNISPRCKLATNAVRISMQVCYYNLLYSVNTVK